MSVVEPQNKKKSGRKLIWIFFWLTLFSACGLTAIFIYLPSYVEKELLPDLARAIGAPGFRGEVRRIGLTGADLAGLTIGDNESSPMVLESLRVYYSPGGLLQKRIDSIVVNGLELNCRFADKSFEIKGFEQLFSIPGGRKATKGPPTGSFSIGSLQVRSSVLVIDYQGQKYRLPFEVLVMPLQTAGWDRLRCLLTIYPRDQELQLSATVDFFENRARLNISAENLRLDRFSDLAGKGFDLAGAVNLSAELDLQLKPFQLSSTELNCELQGARLQGGGFIVGGDKEPVRLQISGSPGKWRGLATGLTVFSPAILRVPSLQADMEILNGVSHQSGNIEFELLGFDAGRQARFEMIEPIKASGSFSGSYNENSDWNFELVARPAGPGAGNAAAYRARVGQMEIRSKTPDFLIKGQGDKAGWQSQYRLSFPELRLGDKESTYALSAATMQGSVRSQAGAAQQDNWLADCKLVMPAVHINTGSADFSGGFSFAGSMAPATESSRAGCPIRMSGKARIINAEALLKDKKLAARGISAELPVQWPIKDAGEKGSLVVEALDRDGLQLGNLHSEIRQQGMGLIFQGRHESRLINALVAEFKGRADFDPESGYESEVFFNVPDFTLSRFNLGKISPGAAGILLDGEAGLNGYFSTETGVNKGSMRAELKNSRFEFKDKGLTVEGINLSLSLPALPELRSAPQQILTFKQARFGDLIFADGKVDFQVEPPGSVFIEKSIFGWSSGHVSVNAFRISPGVSDYSMVLYCDRLRLSEILEQFGAVRAEGEGAVNGIIPVTIKEGRISFADGYLYSTPGEGGSIRVTGADTLAAGIPRNTPQFSQIDFAMEALKDFRYKWVKLYLVSEGDDLVLKLRLDGQPGKPLPFVYQREFGTFARLEVTAGGGILQPILLDANFRLPLNRILDYSKGIHEVFDRLK